MDELKLEDLLIPIEPSDPVLEHGQIAAIGFTKFGVEGEVATVYAGVRFAHSSEDEHPYAGHVILTVFPDAKAQAVNQDGNADNLRAEVWAFDIARLAQYIMDAGANTEKRTLATFVHGATDNPLAGLFGGM
jgi:hypothetical protein